MDSDSLTTDLVGDLEDFADAEPVNLSDVQLRAIEMIVRGFKYMQIAQHLNINPKTMWRWKTLDEDYRAALNEARIQAYANASDRYRPLPSKASGIFVQFTGRSGKKTPAFAPPARC